VAIIEAGKGVPFEGHRKFLRPTICGHATLRVFVAAFRAVRGFFRDAAVFLTFGWALTEDRNSSLGCFAVRW
jgi:hypothetical protein